MAGGRSITIDIYAQDSEKRVFDIEVQRQDRGADVRRARFHSSMIDTKMLREKQDFRCTNAADMFYPLLAAQVQYFKETEGGKRILCKTFEDLAEKRMLEEKKQLAKSMLLRGRGTVEQVAEDLELPIEVVEELVNLQPV